ncbi:uncharacterized protein PHACADRAFT_196533 [Phanerochaete carnosa HHB-10118-sp]|uniref:AB hydrolase-1 domain-containing protein n=1 Tax=Phanerochaete carnosa (strain HHB-10118-sp) TaxID=650164 RepID=K5W4L2_PHACS|nr:uncharacterized protein PHACADRAFT_196533 [Phanerochaete carnosa HHB-10118-sp]EKM54100.1 hypothetical protein PHACADRAFT_196533 [Phanerochaete carnosa HHB-10118-sp]
MDASLYRDHVTSRGVKYHYWSSPAEGSKPTLLFCHGFPSTSRDWRFVVPLFKEKSFGVIVPDMLGYGDTDKPEDPAAYCGSLLIQDLVDILDKENVDKVIVVGHDYFHPERALAYAYFSGFYISPSPGFDLQKFLESTKAVGGRYLFGYIKIFGADPEAERVIEAHIDSFISQWFPRDPIVWRDYISPIGAHRRNLLADHVVPIASYMTEENIRYFKETFAKGGWTGPLNWYRAMVHGR